MKENNSYNRELTQIAHNITVWAAERGVAMRELADQTGVPYTYLAQADQGSIPDRITLLHLTAISQFFGRKVHELMS